MKILLIYPFFLSKRIHVEEIQAPPLGLYYVGAALKQAGHDVEILNWWDAGENLEKAAEILSKKRPDIIGFSVLNANRWGAVSLARLAKEINPRVKVICGGVGATFLWDHLLRHFPWIDLVVIGEGEEAMREIAEALESGRPGEISRIRGIAYREGTRHVKTPPRPPIQDLDTLADPAAFFDFAHVSSSRGCPWACSFCGSPLFWGRKVRFHSPRYFVSQLKSLRARGRDFFFFSDDTFTLRKDRVIEICNLIIEERLGISWFAISRADCIDEEMLYWMRMAGCIQISYGVESGSASVRKTLNKVLDEESLTRAFDMTRRYGILPRAYFIYGSPGENRSTIAESMDLIRRLKPLSAIFYILDIFPGTALYEDFKKRTGLTDDIWLKPVEDIMYLETDPSLSTEMVMEFGETLRGFFWKSVPEFAGSIELVDLPEMRPLHADFLSRLGMTFTHGDYSNIEMIPDKDKTASLLFERALSFHGDHRAYLGLAILMQRQGRHQEAAAVAAQGLESHPQSDHLRMCLGISLLALRRYSEALGCFTSCKASPQRDACLEQCRKALEAQQG
jgi:radical SAM superfamily enzyme YgiQ (UPF0313 family)